MQKLKYAPKGSQCHNVVNNGYKKGVYLLNQNGYVYSHSIPTDNFKQKSPLTFKDGDIVSVELDPISGRLSYTKDSLTFVQNTGIRSTCTSPIHFCTMLNCAYNDITII